MNVKNNTKQAARKTQIDTQVKKKPYARNTNTNRIYVIYASGFLAKIWE